MIMTQKLKLDQNDIFASIPHKRVVSKNGHGEEIFDLYQCGSFKNGNDDENLELVELSAESQYRPHYHKNSFATIYIISGTGEFILDKQQIQYNPGLRIHIPAGALHGFRTKDKTLFLSIQSPSIIDRNTQEVDLYYEDGRQEGGASNAH